MIKYFSKLAAGLSLLVLAACSDQYKIVNPGGDSEDLNAMLDRMETVQVNGFDQGLANQLLEDVGGTTYFTSAPSNGLVPESTFSIADSSPFTGSGNGAIQFPNAFDLFLDQVSIAFVDGLSANNDQYFMLLIEFNYQNDQGYAQAFKSISGPGSYGYSEDLFEARFISQGTSGETIVLRTFDLDPDVSNKLADNVQFQVYILDGNGIEYHIGQFSTLAGFGS